MQKGGTHGQWVAAVITERLSFPYSFLYTILWGTSPESRTWKNQIYIRIMSWSERAARHANRPPAVDRFLSASTVLPYSLFDVSHSCDAFNNDTSSQHRVRDGYQ